MFLDFLYETDTRDMLLDEAYQPPVVAPEQWHDWQKVAEFKGEGDGLDCEVYESRWPARFYKLVVKPTPNSIGEINPGFALSTGSGSEVGKLIFTIARQVAAGMLGLAKE